MDRGEGGYVCGGMCHACMYMHTCTCMINMDASMLAAICNFYTCTHVYVYVLDPKKYIFFAPVTL